MRMMIKKNNLSNGIRTICTHKENTGLCAVKIFIKVGSQNDGDRFGITHVLEHMLFENRQVNQQVFYAVEKYGGVFNAVTTRDYLATYFVIRKEYLYTVLPLVLETIFQFNLAADLLESEKTIILQEILTHQNSPGAMWDLFSLYYWNEHPLRNPIRGYVQTVNQFCPEHLIEHYNKYFNYKNIVISCCGDILEEEFTGFLDNYFSHFQKKSEDLKVENLSQEEVKREKIIISRNLSLAHLFIAFPVTGLKSSLQPYFKTFAQLLGEGFYSRLYKRLREDERLVYSVEAKHLPYEDTGIFLIYTKSSPEMIDQVEDVINHELIRLRSELISSEELEFVKTQYAGSLYRKFETTLSLASVFGIEELLTNQIIPFETVLDQYAEITDAELQKIANNYLINPKTIIIKKDEKSEV